MIELLAPASRQTFKSAIDNGADAVYLGLDEFSARKGADNFSREELEKACYYAHLFGAKVYCALNTIIKDSELESFFNAVKTAWEAHVDAIIIQDIMLGAYIKSKAPEIVLHLSTQAGVCTVGGAKIAKEKGFSRVVLARETPIETIEEIAKIIECEVFVQGALCSSFSGGCYMSSLAGGNSGNRGLCKQPCRKAYTLDDGEECYAISTSDLCVGEDIFRLIKVGVTSFKIEGRMRRAEYVASSVRYYRNVLDKKAEDLNLKSELMRAYNRGNYTKGLAFGQDKSFLTPLVQNHIGENIGRVSRIMGSRVEVKSTLKPKIGDGFKFLRNGREVGGAEYREENLTKNGFILNVSSELKVNDLVMLTTDVALQEKLEKASRKIDFHACVFSAVGMPLTILLNTSDNKSLVYSDELLDEAKSHALTEEELIENLSKVDDLPFNLASLEYVEKSAVFIRKSLLNSLRRRALKELADAIVNHEERVVNINCVEQEVESVALGEKLKESVVITSSSERRDGVNLIVHAPEKYTPESKEFKTFLSNNQDLKKYLYVPAFLTKADEQAVCKCISYFDGVYADGISGVAIAENCGKELFIGTGMNVFNTMSASLWTERAERVALSIELTKGEINRIQRALPEAKLFAINNGDLKVMTLGYCPYGHDCANCKGKSVARLTDYAGRAFVIRRVRPANCQFEIYNNAQIKADYDINPISVEILNREDYACSSQGTYTKGHSHNPTK